MIFFVLGFVNAVKYCAALLAECSLPHKSYEHQTKADFNDTFFFHSALACECATLLMLKRDWAQYKKCD